MYSPECVALRSKSSIGVFCLLEVVLMLVAVGAVALVGISYLYSRAP